MTVRFLLGDVFECLASMPDESVDCIVTSPPYWGLRDYGVAGQLGMEPTIGEHLEVMVAVFDALRRVLAPDGTVWLNYGDCYATHPNGRSAAASRAAGTTDDRTFRDKPFSTVGGSLKPKDLCMVPNRLAIALQDAGWFVRSEIIWAKPNPMPESIRDRPATSHEKIFMLTKSARYFYDAQNVRIERATPADGKMPDGWDSGPGAHGSRHKNGREKGAKIDKQRGHGRRHEGFNDRWDQMTRAEQSASGRNLRNYEPAPPVVWNIATRPFKGAHFATFPPEIVARCIAAGCKPGGHVLDPFGGAGTTGLVADRMQRNATLIEINPEYLDLARKRIEADRGGLLAAMTDDDTKDQPEPEKGII